jgi:DNA polymerase-2
MQTVDGFLLDVYSDPVGGGVVLWLLADNGDRLLLRQHFPITFYAAGSRKRLRELWTYLSQHPIHPSLSRTQRRELFSPDPLTLMEIRVEKANLQPRLFREVVEQFPELDYFDADIPIFPRYAARYDVFALSHCRVDVNDRGWVESILTLDSRWDLDPQIPPLRILGIEPDCDPFHAPPRAVHLHYGGHECCLSLKPDRALLVGISAILRSFDPDLIVSDFGDTWLLPYLLELSKEKPDRLPLCRDLDRPPQRKIERTLQSYGRIIHRGGQVILFGRLHIDRRNAMMFGDYGLDGVFEMARVSGLNIQTAARNSPGAGITAMQIITALRNEILVPHHKQQTETPKTAMDLIQADRGGLIATPLLGLFENVAEIDFISMYPSIIRHFNVSPETLGEKTENSAFVPGVNLVIDQSRQGLLPETLGPLLDKRIAIKHLVTDLHPKDCRVAAYKARAQAIKWLLVVCFGYTGYRNARFGRIEAHMSITAYARDVVLQAKEVAEQKGYMVIGMYVDCLWICKKGDKTVEDFQPVVNAIADRTGLPIALDGVFKWVNFLPSRIESRISVPNRYFGVFQDGEIKMRGIETRRRDTPPWINQIQIEILQIMAKAADAEHLPDQVPSIVALLRRRIRELRHGQVKMDQLLVRLHLTRALNEYRGNSAAARAARQLASNGKSLSAGDSVRLLYTIGKPGVAAWDIPQNPDLRSINVERYTILLLRAASSALTPLRLSEADLAALISGCIPLALPFDARCSSISLIEA